MEKYLFFNTGANDSICLPASRLVEMAIGAGTALNLHFIAPFGGDDGVGEITLALTITDNTGKAVMNAITDEIRLGKEPFIKVCDDTNSEFLHPDIASVGSITDFA